MLNNKLNKYFRIINEKHLSKFNLSFSRMIGILIIQQLMSIPATIMFTGLSKKFTTNTSKCKIKSRQQTRFQTMDHKIIKPVKESLYEKFVKT